MLYLRGGRDACVDGRAVVSDGTQILVVGDVNRVIAMVIGAICDWIPWKVDPKERA